MRKWTCIIAGGPDHGAMVPQWCDFTDAMPPGFEGSDGMALRPIQWIDDGEDHRCVMLHPSATPHEVEAAMALMDDPAGPPI